MADAIGAHRIGLRLAPGGTAWGIVEDDLQALYQALMTELSPLGIGYVHVLDTTDVDTIGLLRKSWSGTFMVNPGGQWSKPGQSDQTDQQAGQAWLDRGADLVSFGRAYLANPDLVERFRQGLELRPAPTQDLWYGGDEKGLITYPTHAYDAAS
ncbi:hypothetical protein HQQ80_02140 [Microbacteriaceae bacterium VKM Ac-2855]|nr:hypothetical protein [Microbacteriaceae bacterium VKM Ac-2855]